MEKFFFFFHPTRNRKEEIKRDVLSFLFHPQTVNQHSKASQLVDSLLSFSLCKFTHFAPLLSRYNTILGYNMDPERERTRVNGVGKTKQLRGSLFTFIMHTYCMQVEKKIEKFALTKITRVLGFLVELFNYERE